MFWNKFPYTNFHELNLDWILNKIKDIISGNQSVGLAEKAIADEDGNNIVSTYATKTYSDSTFETKSDAENSHQNLQSQITNIVNGTTIVGKATADGNGNNIVNTYETKTDADASHSSLETSISQNTTNISNITSGAVTVGKATADGNGNNIVNTYETKSEATASHNGLQTSINQNSTNITNIVNGTTAVGKATSDANGNNISETYEEKSHATAEYARLDARIDNIPGGGGGESTEFFDMSSVFVLSDKILNDSQPGTTSNWFLKLRTMYGGSSSTWDYRAVSGIGFAKKDPSTLFDLAEYVAAPITIDITSEVRGKYKTVLVVCGSNDNNGSTLVTRAQAAANELKTAFPNAKIIFFTGVNFGNAISGFLDINSSLTMIDDVYVCPLAYTWLGLKPSYVTGTSPKYLTAEGNNYVASCISNFIDLRDSVVCNTITITQTSPTINGNITASYLQNGAIIEIRVQATAQGGFPINATNIIPSTLFSGSRDIINKSVVLSGADSTLYFGNWNINGGQITCSGYAKCDVSQHDNNVTSIYNGYIPSGVVLNDVAIMSYPLK